MINDDGVNVVQDGDYFREEYYKTLKLCRELQTALRNCRGFCVKCGASYPHRYGEGRMIDCCGVVQSAHSGRTDG